MEPKISIITPFYYGNKYMRGYFEMIKRAIKKFPSVEVILVNDSPDEKIKYADDDVEGISLKIIGNKENVGIQESRVNGLNVAVGEYVIFLDQDDAISESALASQYEAAQREDADIVLGNGFVQVGNKEEKIYGNKFSQNFAIKKRNYLWVRDFIISPGQTLIKKEVVPREWKKNIMKKNGCDDYFLWLLCLNNGAEMACNYKCVYTHNSTGENFSADSDKMYASQLEMIGILSRVQNYNVRDLKLLRRMILFKHNYKCHFLKTVLLNLDIFLYNCYYRIVWRGHKTRLI